MTTIYDLLDELRASAISEADKGSKFERLMKAPLPTSYWLPHTSREPFTVVRRYSSVEASSSNC